MTDNFPDDPDEVIPDVDAPDGAPGGEPEGDDVQDDGGDE